MGVILLVTAALVVRGGERAAGVDRPALPAIGQGVQVDPDYSCIVCHADKRRAFLMGVHSERGIRCHDCHGGDPTGFERETAHNGRDYIGTPDKLETVVLCSSCHSDPDQMRQYGLPVGQLAEFRTSRHGHLLLEQNDLNAPTCSDCHNSHMILPPNDARSNVYPTNIVRTCAGCHENADLMGRYGLPTNQVERHRESAHGFAMFDDQNFAAPTCVDCHGSHAALPPAVTQIADVCGHCHVLVRRSFYEGPHGDAATSGLLPGCTACHSNHGTERVPPTEIASTCTACHAADSPAALLGSDIQHEVTEATEELLGAEEAIQALVRAGRRVTEMNSRHEAAHTAYEQLGQAQHSLDLAALEDLSRQVSSISRDIRSTEEVAAEERWEHKLILIPVWFLAMSISVLALFKLRGLAKRGH
jgi:hypothetical protein